MEQNNISAPVNLEQYKYIFTCRCPEPEGDIYRSVYPIYLSLDAVRKIWDKTRPFKTLLNKELREDFDSFLQIFCTEVNGQFITDSLFWRIDDFIGLYYLTGITDVEATAHFTFFDRRFKGRSGMTHRMLRHLFQRYKFQRLNVEVPVYVGENIHKFVRGLGFVREGKKRRAVMFDNKFFDVIQYGLINDEYMTASKARWEQSKRLNTEELSCGRI